MFFLVILSYSTLIYFRLFLILKFILGYSTLGYFKLFSSSLNNFRLLYIIVFLVI
jgi:hypothetical protein